VVIRKQSQSTEKRARENLRQVQKEHLFFPHIVDFFSYLQAVISTCEYLTETSSCSWAFFGFHLMEKGILWTLQNTPALASFFPSRMVATDKFPLCGPVKVATEKAEKKAWISFLRSNPEAWKWEKEHKEWGRIHIMFAPAIPSALNIYKYCLVAWSFDVQDSIIVMLISQTSR